MGRLRVALLGCAAVLVAAGVWFASLDIGAADQYASVASFLLALIVAAATVGDRLRHRPPAQPQPAQPPPPVHAQGARTVYDSGVVSMGDNAVINATVDGSRKPVPPPGKGRTRPAGRRRT